MSDKPTDKDADQQIEWLPVAKELLARRDRFTQLEIKKDFAKNWGTNRVVLFKDLYATFVAGNRYTVIWRGKGDKPIQVKAVVASQFRGENAQQLKEKLEETVKVETHGLVKSLV